MTADTLWQHDSAVGYASAQHCCQPDSWHLPALLIAVAGAVAGAGGKDGTRAD
jgi:hypothetical protein